MEYTREELRECYLNEINDNNHNFYYYSDYNMYSDCWATLYEVTLRNEYFYYENLIPSYDREKLADCALMDYTDLIMLYYYNTVKNPTNYEDIELPKEELRELILDFIEDVIIEKYDEFYCRITKETQAELIQYIYNLK